MANEVEIVVSAVDKTGPGLQSAKKNTDDLGKSAGIAGDVLDALGPIGAAAGAAIALGLGAALKALDFLKDAVDESIQRTNSLNKMGAQLGYTGEDLARLGKVAGQIYADNFGESFESVNDTLKSVIQNLRGFTDESEGELRDLAEFTLTLGQTLGEDANAITRAVSQMLRTGLVATAKDAFDLLQQGAQEGVNKAGDLLDTFNEYGTQFRKLGLDGAQAMGLMNQAIKAGARDSDVAADALKEFSIRAVDGSKSTIQGFKDLGLNAKEMASNIAAGGDRARGALDLVLDKLRAIKDPVLQAQIATKLFGTQAEDLGAALYAMDLDTATAQLGDFKDATAKAAITMGNGLGPVLESMHRQWENMKAEIGDKLVPVINILINDVIPHVVEKLKVLADAFMEIWNRSVPYIKSAFEDLKRVYEENKDSIEKLTPILEALGIVLGVVVVGAIVALIGWAEMFIDFLGYVGDMFEKLVKGGKVLSAELLRFFGEILDAAVWAFGWIPGIGDKLKTSQAQFKAWAAAVTGEILKVPAEKGVIIRVSVSGLSQAANAIADVANRSYYAQIGVGVLGSRATGGIVAAGHAAEGGAKTGLIEVGEHGREFVRVPSGSMIYPEANSNQMEANARRSGGDINVYVQGSILSEREIVKIIRDEFKRGGFRGVVTA